MTTSSRSTCRATSRSTSAAPTSRTTCARCSTSSRTGSTRTMQVRVVGHTDATGSDAINNPLSVRPRRSRARLHGGQGRRPAARVITEGRARASRWPTTPASAGARRTAASRSSCASRPKQGGSLKRGAIGWRYAPADGPPDRRRDRTLPARRLGRAAFALPAAASRADARRARRADPRQPRRAAREAGVGAHRGRQRRRRARQPRDSSSWRATRRSSSWSPT